MEDFEEIEQDIKTTDKIDVNDLMQKRSTAFLTFEKELSQFDPEPEEPQPFSWKELGLKFFIVLITSVAAVLQAAMRTGAKFMELAKNSQWSENLQRIDGITAMVGVEGIVFMAGWLIGAKKERKHSLTESWELWLALGISLSISIVTGSAQAVTSSTDQGLRNFLDGAVLLLLGPGASILAFFAGELVGIVINEAQANAKERLDKWAAEHDEWKNRMIEAWKNSEVYAMLNVHVNGATEVTAKMYKNAAKLASQRTAPATPVHPQQISLSKRVKEYLLTNGFMIQDVGSHPDAKITVKQLAEELQITSATYPDPAELTKMKKHLTKVMADLRKQIPQPNP